MLGAVGVKMGTRFLASKEAPIEDAWKAAMVQSEDAMKVEVLNDIQPLPRHRGVRHGIALFTYAIHGGVGYKTCGGASGTRAILDRDPGKSPGRPAPRDAAHGGSDLRGYQGNPARGRDHTATNRRG
jgi:hypothetical protein